ncbi:MAG: hypothetical protein WAN11_27685 [Syntrophobacteraceae bacterium]
MTDEIFARNKSIDAAFKQMLTAFDETSQRRMKKAMRDAGNAIAKQQTEEQTENADAGTRHKFREFIPACILNLHGYSFQYEVQIDSKTPDWLDNKSNLLMEVFTFERGGKSSFQSRVYSGAEEKCSKYSNIADNHPLLIVVAVYLDFATGLDFDDCEESFPSFRPLFDQYQRLAGILFIIEESGGFLFGGQLYKFMCLAPEARLVDHPSWRPVGPVKMKSL